MTGIAPAEIYQAFLNQGVSPSDAATLTAISGAESGYNAAAIGDTSLENATWGPSVGLFQIRTKKAATGTGTYRDIDTLDTFPGQVQAAVDVLDTQGLNAWTTYTDGAYRAYLGDVNDTTPPDGSGGSGAGVENAGLLSDIFGDAGKAVFKASGVSKLLYTGIFAVAGAALVITGLAITAKDTGLMPSGGAMPLPIE